MASVETTTIRVRRATQRRLAREAELAGKSVVEVLDAAVDLLEEQRLLASMDRSYRERGDEIHEEMGPLAGRAPRQPTRGPLSSPWPSPSEAISTKPTWIRSKAMSRAAGAPSSSSP